MSVAAVMAIVFALSRFIRPARQHPFQRWQRREYWDTGQGGFWGELRQWYQRAGSVPDRPRAAVFGLKAIKNESMKTMKGRTRENCGQ